jgi:hypothetical protein
MFTTPSSSLTWEGPSQCHKIVTFWNKKTAVLATGVRAAAL